MNNKQTIPAMTRRPDLLSPGKDLKRRYRTDKWFQRIGISAIVLSLAFIALLFVKIASEGYSAFVRATCPPACRTLRTGIRQREPGRGRLSGPDQKIPGDNVSRGHRAA
jgi:hypothetical protein